MGNGPYYSRHNIHNYSEMILIAECYTCNEVATSNIKMGKCQEHISNKPKSFGVEYNYVCGVVDWSYIRTLIRLSIQLGPRIVHKCLF